MNWFASQIGKLWRENAGATATEYAFIIAFIAIVAAAGMAFMGTSLSSFYTSVGSALSEMVCVMPGAASDRGKGKSKKCKNN